LQGAGLSLANVVKANIYLSDLSKDFAAVNEVSYSMHAALYPTDEQVWKELMPDPKPARTCIGVKELPAGGTDVEIEFVAYDEKAKL